MANSDQQAENQDFRAAERMMVIGLDGATFDVLKPMMADGKMPNLKKFIESGTHGILDSTVPPITPAAWTTFMTGKGPGRHGIIDFEKYDVSTGKLSFNSSLEIHERTLWQILSDKNKRVGVIGVPMTYPPYPVNGFLVSGFETPGTDVQFTHPPELKDELLKLCPDYSYRTHWRRKTLGGDELFKTNLEHITRSFDQGLTLATQFGDRYGWDVLMVMYKLVDNLLHKTWRYLDARTAGRWPQRAAWVADCFRHLDDVLGQLFEYAAKNKASVMIMSDHGHGSLEGKAQPNLLLKQWGYLVIKSSLTQARRRAEKVINQTLGRTRKRFESNLGIEKDIVLDWSKTRACVMHAGMNGFLYISLKGRQPDGIVEPDDYEKLRDELKERFLGVTCPGRDGRPISVFSEVHKPEELYNCRREDQPWMPDLLLVPHPGLAVVRKIRGGRPVVWSRLNHMEGTHRQEGIFAAGGVNIRSGQQIHANIADVTPTLLAAMGLPVPDDMEGRVLDELFETAPSVQAEQAGAATEAQSREVFSDEEKKALTQRLIDLGYLE